MLNSNAADQFVLSCQHCSISSVKLLWISVKLWECEDQEMIVSTAPSTAGAFNFWSKQQWLLCFTISDGFVLFCFAWLFLILFYIIYLFIYFPLGPELRCFASAADFFFFFFNNFVWMGSIFGVGSGQVPGPRTPSCEQAALGRSPCKQSRAAGTIGTSEGELHREPLN